MSNSKAYEINSSEFELISKQLSESPFNVIPIHLLNRKLCRTFAINNISNFQTLIIQPNQLKSEPIAVGRNINEIAELLSIIEGWECVNVDKKISNKLSHLLSSKFNKKIKIYKDLYYTLKKIPNAQKNKPVRLLDINDLEILSKAKPELQGTGFKSCSELLTEGVIAGTIIDNNLVAIAHTSAFSKNYADVAVYTLSDYRGQGFAKAAAILVCDKLIKQNLTPVWSCGEDNFPSIKIAKNLGFEYFNNMNYLIPE